MKNLKKLTRTIRGIYPHQLPLKEERKDSSTPQAHIPASRIRYIRAIRGQNPIPLCAIAQFAIKNMKPEAGMYRDLSAPGFVLLASVFELQTTITTPHLYALPASTYIWHRLRRVTALSLRWLSHIFCIETGRLLRKGHQRP